MLICLFDAVGTTIDPDPHPVHVYQEHGQRHGSQLASPEIDERFAAAVQRCFGSPSDLRSSDDDERRRWQQVVATVFSDLADTRELFADLWRHFADPGHWRLFDDVAVVWQRLLEWNIPVGIASNFDSRLELICRSLPPLNQLDYLFVSSQVGWRKPAPQFFQTVNSRLPPASTVIFVGDSFELDVIPARNVGWNAFRIRRTMDAPHQPRDLHDLVQLISIVEELK